MRIKINDKIYRLKEIESGVDSLMELVEEPKYNEGDFLHSDWEDENITIIYRKRNGSHLYYHASKSNGGWLSFKKDAYWPNNGDFRLATESEKKELIDALTGVGKRLNAEKKCVEDIPKRRFKKGDKVRIKHGVSSKTHGKIDPCFVENMDDLIGKTMTVDGYTNGNYYVYCEGIYWSFLEDWLEPYTDEPKKGDLAIFWDDDQAEACIGIYNQFSGSLTYPHKDIIDNCFRNAVKFESTEQYERFIKGEL